MINGTVFIVFMPSKCEREREKRRTMERLNRHRKNISPSVRRTSYPQTRNRIRYLWRRFICCCCIGCCVCMFHIIIHTFTAASVVVAIAWQMMFMSTSSSVLIRSCFLFSVSSSLRRSEQTERSHKLIQVWRRRRHQVSNILCANFVKQCEHIESIKQLQNVKMCV